MAEKTPEQLLEALKIVRTKVENTVTTLKESSKANDIITYHNAFMEFKKQIREYHDVLNIGKSYKEDEVTHEFKTEYMDHANYATDIYKHLPKPPQYVEEKKPKVSKKKGEQQALLQKEEQEELKRHCLQIIETHEQDMNEIINIITQLREVKSQFIKLHSLVKECSEHIDHIETYVEETHTHMKNAVVDLEKGNKYQRQGSKKLWIMFGVCGVVALIVLALMILAVALKVTGGEESSE